MNVGGVGLVTGSLANVIAVRLGRISLHNLHRITLPYFAALLTATIALAALTPWPG